LPGDAACVRRDEDATLFIVTAWLYRERGFVPRVLSPKRDFRQAAGVDALVSRGVRARVCGEIDWRARGIDYEGVDASGNLLTMEVKGSDQNGNQLLYAGMAWLQACGPWTEDAARHRIAVGFADHDVYRRAFGKIPQALRQHVNAWFYIVLGDEQVVEVTPQEPWPWSGHARRRRADSIEW